ncbi:MAG TPA: hypothetical protein VJY12_09145 [Dysgonamonadaceae bacterium]|jgi:carbon monoxide dehydrogenase subunit G|nr:hypothetical protein [Dysgonamonadaceae bacterium]
MTEFVSDIKKIAHPNKMVFDVLSDLSKLELLKDRLPSDKITEFTCDQDSCSFSVAPVGRVKFVVVDREPNKTIKFRSEQLPFEVNVWVQLVSKAEDDTRMKITLRADLNTFIKPMVSKPMKEGVDKISDVIASLPFDQL